MITIVSNTGCKDFMGGIQFGWYICMSFFRQLFGTTECFKICYLHLSWTCIKFCQRLHILCLGGKTVKFMFFELEVPWGSLYLSWYTQGFLGVSLGDLNSGRDCLRPIPTPPWVCLAHAMVVEFFKRFFWFRLRQFLGAWHLDLGFDPNFYFQDIFLLPPGLSSLVWCLHWVSLLLVWVCKNCLGRITLWNIYTVQLLSFFWIHTLGYFCLWKNVCNFSLPLCWLGFSFDLRWLLWDLYVFAPNTLDLLMGCTLASFSLNWRRIVAVLALILLNLSASISSGVWFPIMLLFLPVSESSGTWFPFPVVFSVEGTIADWKWTPKSFWLMSLPFFIIILIAMINNPIIGRTMRLKNTIKQAGNFLSWSSGRLKGNYDIRLFIIITVGPITVLHRSICDVFWGLRGRSYSIIIQYGYQMKG